MKPRTKEWNWMSSAPLQLQPPKEPSREVSWQMLQRRKVDALRQARQEREELKEVWE